MRPYRIFVLLILSVIAAGGGTAASVVHGLPATAQTGEAPKNLNIPNDTAVTARLLTNLDAAQAKVGDAIDAETTENVKQGHDTLLKKGSMLNGHIISVQRFASADAPCTLAILFDRVTLKNGEQFALNVGIQALAPLMDVKSDTLASGRGMMQSANDAANSPTARGNGQDGRTVRTDATVGSVDGLSNSSKGVYGMPGASLGYETNEARYVSVVKSTSGDLRMKKGMQLVVKVVAEQ
jgi:hypothetical protein